MTQNLANKKQWSKQTNMICSPRVQFLTNVQRKTFTLSPLIISLATLQNSKC